MLASITEFDSLADHVQSAAKGRPRIFIAIDGPGASGKSTLARELAASIVKAHVIHVDDFYLPTSDRRKRRGLVGELFDLARLACEVVLPGSEGQALRYQRYDWSRDVLAEWVDVPEGAPIILEGVFCLAKELREAYTYRIWCRADPGLRLARGLARDGEGARSNWTDLWMPAEQEYESAERPETAAELVVDSSQQNEDGRDFA